MKHCCRNCHFMAIDMNARRTQPWDKARRESLVPDNPVTAPKPDAGCYRGVWRSLFLPRDDNGNIEIESFRNKLLKDRRESCFFVEYQEGMDWNAANDLQHLEYENRHLKKNYRNTLLGLFIAGFGLVFSAIFEILNFLFKNGH